MRIGIAGTGKMGSAIAARLHTLGHQVTVWNRSRERAQPLLASGIGWAETPAMLAQSADIIVSLLTNEQALDDVYLSADGLLSGSVTNKLFVEMSTVKPDKHAALAQQANAVHAVYLECPVSGSVGPAKDGKLIGFVGGDSADVARAKPFLDLLCRRVEHVGPYGSGATMKLSINLPLMVYWQTLGEALSLIEPLGLDPQRVIDIFSDSSGGPNMLKVRGPMIAKALSGEHNDAITVNVATMRKDVRAMLAQAKATNQKHARELPLTEATLKSFDQAAQSGLDQSDCTQLLVWWLAEGGRSKSQTQT
jgi:3-hydroxyisobutyrate dehydrogenase